MPEKLKRTVAILYQLCFGLSQKSNFLQEDNGCIFEVAIFRRLALKPGVFWAQVVQAIF